MADEAEQDAAQAVEQDVVDESTADDVETPDEPGAEALGDAGKQALDRMKSRLKAAEAARKAAERERDEARGISDQEKARRASDEAILAKASRRILRSEVKAAAKGVLADPTDAFRFLDLDQFDVDEDGNVDESEIAEALSELARTKPYLAAQGGRRFQGDADGGSRKDARPKQLTKSDLDRMTPAEIDAAHKQGRLADLLKS